MDDDLLLPLTVVELLALLAALAVVSASLLGWTDLLSSFSRPVRLAVFVFLVVEILVPAWVYYDLRRRGAVDEGGVWIHASVMPVVNLLAVVAYRAERDDRPD